MSEEMKSEYQLDIEDMAQARVASPAWQSLKSGPFVGMRKTLPSEVALVSSFLDELMNFISRFRMANENNFEIELALREALVNAIVHGNRQDPRKRVYVNCRCSPQGEVSITVEDEGSGFDHDELPDPTSADNLLLTHGRGIFLIGTLMDDVYFERGGSVVHMRKRANASADSTRKAQ